MAVEWEGWRRGFCHGCWSLLHPQIIKDSPLDKALQGAGGRGEPNIVRLDVAAMLAMAEERAAEREGKP